MLLVLLLFLLKFSQTSWQDARSGNYNRFLEGPAQINEGLNMSRLMECGSLDNTYLYEMYSARDPSVYEN